MIDCRNTRVEENMLIIIHNGVGVCSPNVALCASETARFKGLITLAIRFCAAGTVSLSLSLLPCSQYLQTPRGREEGRRSERTGQRKSQMRAEKLSKRGSERDLDNATCVIISVLCVCMCVCEATWE